MILKLRNNNTLEVDDFQFRCCIGKKGLISSKKKEEGDLSTPKGFYKLKELYYREDKYKKLECKLKKKIIKKNLGWCCDSTKKSYNKVIKITKKNKKYEKLYRDDTKYDIIIILDYNMKKTIPGKGSAIFIHITKDYKPTAGCIAFKEKDLLIMLKILKKNSYIKI